MIKITQVLKVSQRDETYYLRDTSINPQHIVSVNTSDKYIMLLHQNKLPEGLSKEHHFVEISLSHGGTLIAVGTPEIINEKIKFSKKLLLG